MAGVRIRGIRTGRRLLGLGCVSVLVLAGCGTSFEDDQPTGTGTGEGAGEGTTLVAAITEGDPMDWDPSVDNEKASINFGDTLTRLDPQSGKLIGALAESFELSPDGKTWTFHLRPDVKFHDDWGTVTSEDVAFTWSEWTAEDSDHGSRARQMRQAVGGSMDGFEIIDDLTFALHAQDPVVALPQVLCDCSTGMTVTSARYFKEQPDVAPTHPIGTGPWQFVSSDPGVEMVLKKTPWKHPWREEPAYDNLIIRTIGDGAAILAQVQSGAVGVGQLSGELAGEAEAAGLKIVSNADIAHTDVMLGGAYFGNNELVDVKAPWIQSLDPADPRGRAIREALSLAIDRQAILDRVLHGQGSLSRGPLITYEALPISYDKNWEFPAYDPVRARQLLAEGGYPNGFQIEMLMFPQEVDTVGMGEAVAGMWEDIGITVKRSRVEEDFVDEQLENRTTAGYAWINANPYYAEPAPTWFNYLNDDDYDDKIFHPAFEDGYSRVVAEPDFDARWVVARGVTEKLREDYLPIDLMSVNMPFILSADVASYTPFPNVNTINSLETVRPA
jgi:peptide/nickel transport system substrate-binding protein